MGNLPIMRIQEPHSAAGPNLDESYINSLITLYGHKVSLELGYND